MVAKTLPLEDSYHTGNDYNSYTKTFLEVQNLRNNPCFNDMFKAMIIQLVLNEAWIEMLAVRRRECSHAPRRKSGLYTVSRTP